MKLKSIFFLLHFNLNEFLRIALVAAACRRLPILSDLPNPLVLLHGRRRGSARPAARLVERGGALARAVAHGQPGPGHLCGEFGLGVAVVLREVRPEAPAQAAGERVQPVPPLRLGRLRGEGRAGNRPPRSHARLPETNPDRHLPAVLFVEPANCAGDRLPRQAPKRRLPPERVVVRGNGVRQPHRTKRVLFWVADYEAHAVAQLPGTCLLACLVMTKVCIQFNFRNQQSSELFDTLALRTALIIWLTINTRTCFIIWKLNRSMPHPRPRLLFSLFTSFSGGRAVGQHANGRRRAPRKWVLVGHAHVARGVAAAAIGHRARPRLPALVKTNIRSSC